MTPEGDITSSSEYQLINIISKHRFGAKYLLYSGTVIALEMITNVSYHKEAFSKSQYDNTKNWTSISTYYVFKLRELNIYKCFKSSFKMFQRHSLYVRQLCENTTS